MRITPQAPDQKLTRTPWATRWRPVAAVVVLIVAGASLTGVRAAATDEQPRRSRWLLLEVTDAGDVSLTAARHTEHEHDDDYQRRPHLLRQSPTLDHGQTPPTQDDGHGVHSSSHTHQTTVCEPWNKDDHPQRGGGDGQAVSSSVPFHVNPHKLPAFHHDGDSLVVTYLHPADAARKESPSPTPAHLCHMHVRNPRKMYHDRDANEDSTQASALSQARTPIGLQAMNVDPEIKLTGGVHHLPRAQFAVTLRAAVTGFVVTDLKQLTATAASPAAAVHPTPRTMSMASSSATTVDHPATRVLEVTDEHHRAFQTLQVEVDTSSIVVTPLQVVGPLSQQPAFVFVSSGFTTAEKKDFDDKVSGLVSFLQGTQASPDKVSPKPYSRYYSTFNMYSVFHPSVQAGASHPLPAGDGTVVKNNLDCAYGENSYRILSCNRAKVSLVGSYAPPPPQRAVYVVIVNDVLFGGTGGGRICSVYAGSRLPVVMIHEMGHAMADLSDEYDYAVNEQKVVPLKNCHYSVDSPPWNQWILAGIIPRPTPVCTYTNYFKPTPSACLMESEQPTMCPVCGQSVVSILYTEGMSLAAPRYPGSYETLYVKNGESSALFMNNRVPYHKDDTGVFDVVWSIGTTRLASATHVLGFNAPNAVTNYTGYTYSNGAGTYTIVVTITDKTNLVLSSDRTKMSVATNISSMRQIHEFRVIVYEGTSSCKTKTTPAGVDQCVVCDTGKEQECALTFTSTPIEKAYDVQGKLNGLDDWLLGVGGFFIALGLISFGLIWKSMQLHYDNTVREILPLTTVIKVFRIILMVSQIVLLCGSSMTIIFAAYMFGVLSVFGRTIIIGIICCAVVVWFASFIGFCAAFYKNRSVMFFNFVFLLLLFGCGLLFTSLLLYMYNNIDTDGVRSQLQAEWRRGVASNPVGTCTLESVLRCSGFNNSCITVNTPAGTSDCPANCEVSNGIGYPCVLRVREFVLEKFFTAAVGGVIFCFVMLVSLILSLFVGCGVKRNKLHVTRLRHIRAERGESTLSPEEVEMLREEFKKIDRDNSNDISREEFALFYNQVMGAKLNPRQLEEYFDKLDADQSGTLSFEEFIKVYVPQKKPKKRTLKEARGVIYQDGMAAAGAASDDLGGDAMQEGSQAAQHDMPSAPGSSQSQRQAHRQPDIELDLIIDDDDLPNATDVANDEAIRLQEEKAQAEASKIAAAQADRQRRLALDRPSNIDVELVVGDLGQLGANADQNLDGFENMDLDFDLGDV